MHSLIGHLKINPASIALKNIDRFLKSKRHEKSPAMQGFFFDLHPRVQVLGESD
jgi:hypothetical protein